MRKIYFILTFLMVTVQLAAAASPTKEEADKAYQENHYAQAAEMYTAILEEQGESAEVYYNLGNCYYKTKEVARAVLCYERALLLNPGDADTRFNLELASSKTVDKITPVSEVFFVTWIKSLVSLRSESQWGSLAVAAFLLLLASMALYIFGNRIALKKAGFISAVVFLVLTVLTNWFAYEQKTVLMERDGAIVMSPSVTIKSTPNESGTDLFVLHEGTKVYIDDDSMEGWKEIRLADGKKGWLPAAAIERI